MKLRRKFGIALAVAAIASPVAVTGVRAGTAIDGTGSTFVANLADICAAQYNRNTLNNTGGDTVAYVSPTGSGAGKTAFSNQTKAWAASDSLYTSGAPSFSYVYVPLVSGSISVMYRLDGVSPAGANVRLSPLTVGRIFAGEIKMWNDPAIQADNNATTIAAVKKVSKGGIAVTAAKVGTKVNFSFTANAAGLKKYKGKSVSITKIVTSGTTTTKTSVGTKVIAAKGALSTTYKKGATYAVKVGGTTLGSLGVDSTTSGVTLTLPSTVIKVAYRSGTSGTTNNFTNFLNKAAGTVWTKAANDSFTTAFPTSIPTDGTFQSASGSDGVANYVRDNNGSITYTEQSYVEERKSASIQSAAIKNNAGVYVLPSAAATGAFYAEAAVADNGVVTPDYTVAAADAYLINAIAYGLGATANSTANAAVRSWFTYFVDKCAPVSGPGAFYAPLAGSIKAKALAQAAKVGAS
jgi:ABC-type phosphate transport system substrate-binding protein